MTLQPDMSSFERLPVFGFDLIMADPPWTFENWSEKGEAKNPSAHYRTLTIEEIAAIPVGSWASRDCYLFLWCTWPLLLGNALGRATPDGEIIEHADTSPVGKVLKAWGFQYVTGGAWLKTTAHGKAHFGTGYVVRSSCEPFLIAKTGNPKCEKTCRNAIQGLAREHSRKPDEAYAWCEKWMPGARKLDLFSRQSRPGWTTAGLEAGKFDEGKVDL